MVAAVAPLIRRRANACSGREGLKMSRAALPRIDSSLINSKFISYKKGNFSVGRFTVYCLNSATSHCLIFFY